MRNPTTRWWASCNKFTVFVEVDENKRIVDTAPVVRRFIGQSFDNLLRWFAGFGGLRYEEIGEGINESTKTSEGR